jgi:hypothetical protein
LKIIPEVTQPSQNLVGELKEITKVTRKNKHKLEGKEAQVSEPMPQYSRIGIWFFPVEENPRIHNSRPQDKSQVNTRGKGV